MGTTVPQNMWCFPGGDTAEGDLRKTNNAALWLAFASTTDVRLSAWTKVERPSKNPLSLQCWTGTAEPCTFVD